MTGDKLASFSDNGIDIYYGGKIVISLEKNGEIRINSKHVATDTEVVYGIRELLKNLERGSVKEL